MLVNNAGATLPADFFALTEEDWQDRVALKSRIRENDSARVAALACCRGSIGNILGVGSPVGPMEFTTGVCRCAEFYQNNRGNWH